MWRRAGPGDIAAASRGGHRRFAPPPPPNLPGLSPCCPGGALGSLRPGFAVPFLPGNSGKRLEPRRSRTVSALTVVTAELRHRAGGPARPRVALPGCPQAAFPAPACLLPAPLAILPDHLPVLPPCQPVPLLLLPASAPPPPPPPACCLACLSRFSGVRRVSLSSPSGCFFASKSVGQSWAQMSASPQMRASMRGVIFLVCFGF